MVRSITSQPISFSRLRACDGEISWSTSTNAAWRVSVRAVAFAASRAATAPWRAMRRWGSLLSASPCTKRRTSSRLPAPRYAVESNLARFCVNVATTSKPRVLASSRSSSRDACSSASLTDGRCTAAMTARCGRTLASLVIRGRLCRLEPK